ncbi:MAG: ROK family protein [Bacteroidales bacterium]|nr:ROK family protein [Bacteroidales bacterium]
MELAIGVDIGGSHISCAAINLENESILKETLAEGDVNNKASADEILEVWSSVLNKTINMAGRENVKGIGFAMPGPFDYVRGVAMFERVEKYESLYGVNVAEHLQKNLKFNNGLPVRFMNDATAFAVGESWIGKGRFSERIVALTLGTGFGSAFIDKGFPVVNGSEVPENGCLWHVKYKNGIADDYISTRWFLKEYENKTGIRLKGVKELANLFPQDEISKRLFQRYGENLGIILTPSLISFHPEMIVIGGNIIGAYDLFAPALQEKIKNVGLNVEVALSELKEDAAMIGAARMIKVDYWNGIKSLLQYM